MNIGYIDYLNCYPLYHEMFYIKPVGGIQIIPAHPSLLNRMVHDGALILSPISAAYYPFLGESVHILPDLCIASNGPVKSVLLYSKYPIEDIDDRTVGLSSASLTSVTMFKILLKKYIGVTPRYAPAPPLPDVAHFDAALTIGNNALGKSSKAYLYCYDIGELWKKYTGYASVFALVAVHTGRRHFEKKKISAVIGSFHSSHAAFAKDKSGIIASAQERYPDIECDLEDYYSHLLYTLSPELITGLNFYFEQAAEMELLPPAHDLLFYE